MSEASSHFRLGILPDTYTCDQHAYTWVLPCPWPGCPKGAESSSIIATTPGTCSETRFKRFQYASLSGEERFLWADDMGSFLTAGARAHMEAKRSGLLAGDPPPAVIYHYTDPSALLEIVESQEIWLTDYAYLNDSSEVEHGIALSTRVLERFLNGLGVAEGLGLILGAARDHISRIEDRRFAVACFSEIDDSLPQWRAYGSVAVGIMVGGLPFGHAPGAVLDRVIYDDAVQSRDLEITVHEHLEAAKVDAQIGRSDDPSLLGEVLAGRIVQRIGFFKHRSFSEEREVRFCFVEDARVNARLSVPVAPKRFRCRGTTIVPYVGSSDIIFRDALSSSTPARKKLPIADIVVGPGERSELVARGIRDLLDYHEYADTIVRHSAIPYRTF